MDGGAVEGNVENIPEREREVLRLLVRGHDAKSIARALGLSLNVVNERLRDSRRRLGVSSSREAARLLAAHEGDNFSGNREIGLGVAPPVTIDDGRPAIRAGNAARRRRAFWMGGPIMLVVAAALGAAALDRREAVPAQTNAPPRVVATKPAAGARIRPGPFLLSVTFDQPMIDGSYSYTRTSPETYPDCAVKPVLSRDARTFTMRCTAAAGRNYEIWFNRPPYMSFRGLNGLSSEPHQLRFRTKPR
jgi:DNA-binding CsgD family transcriptional regulator